MATRTRLQDPPVTTLTRSIEAEEHPLFEDQVREYRQGQRRRYNAQRRLQRITRSITGQGPFNQSLEQQLDPQVQLRLSMQERASIVPAEGVRGYEGWQNDEANILVTRGMVGRLSNTLNVGFAYEIQNVVDYLITHGVRALPGRRYNTREVQGQNWIIHQSGINIPMQPTEVNTRNLLDGRVSIHFDNYQAAITANPPHYNQRDEEIPSDEEEVQHQVIAVLLQDPEVLQVRRISSTAIVPQRKTEGSAGYDLAINREQFVPKKDKSLLTTGICIQIPKGTYARIAPRSSAALRGLIIMRGVIDEDYRGEVKIIAYNITNKHVYLQKHECIAQIILEKITTPDVVEVTCLEPTERGMQGFGSTANLAYPSEAPLPKAQKKKVILNARDVYTVMMVKKQQSLMNICKKNELILSPTKMKLGSPTIEFLSATIGESKIKLQAHIITKIADFNDSELQTTKGLRSWLGLLNYARSYIPNLVKILGPLYSKTSPNGEKNMNSQDWALVRTVKAMIKELPDLTIPPAQCYMLIETDGCMEGWGGICKWKLQKHDSKAEEKICAYASDKFSPPKSTIDAEIHAVMNSLNSFKIYYLDKEELLIRTDCQAIISFFNKSAQNKSSRIRWIAFTDFITGLGIPVHFQHIEGKDNLLADALS
ncbi:hypothetical protein ZIOFF_007089 [Zingiber officinale]|uniref:dUTP diphosphatase n=1 Tax=Zingiber officinale TaxID=94328 RepID=A0A8J5HPG7_ZINOF|nr:hypothetical protein ZIOFF_007089 [Zingiber officinale]